MINMICIQFECSLLSINQSCLIIIFKREQKFTESNFQQKEYSYQILYFIGSNASTQNTFPEWIRTNDFYQDRISKGSNLKKLSFYLKFFWLNPVIFFDLNNI